jgi:predicted MFS family arabinose efflux permease
MPFYIIQMFWVASWSTSVSGPIMPLYVASLGVGETEWGFLAMFHAVGMVTFEWLWGALSDRGNRIFYALISLLVMTIIFPFYTLKILTRYFFLLQFLLGAFSVILGPVSRAIVSDHSSPRTLGLHLSLWSVFMTLGRMIGSILGSYIAQYSSYQHSFYLSSVLSALGAIITLIYLRKDKVKRHKPKKDLLTSFRIGLKNLTVNRTLRTLLIIAVLSFMARSVIWTFLPLYASVVVNMSTIEVGYLSAVISLSGLIASVIIGRFSNTLKKNIIVSTGFFIASILMISYFFIDTISSIYLISIGVSIALSVSPLTVAILSETTSKEHLGMSFGIFGSFEDIGIMMGPAIYGIIWASYQPRYIFVVSGITQLISAFLVLSISSEKLELNT